MKNVLIKAAAVPAAAAFLLIGAGAAVAVPVGLDAPNPALEAGGNADVQAAVADVAKAADDAGDDGIVTAASAGAQGGGQLAGGAAAAGGQLAGGAAAAGGAADFGVTVPTHDFDFGVTVPNPGFDFGVTVPTHDFGGFHGGINGGINGGVHGGLHLDGALLAGLFGLILHGGGHGHEPAPCKPVHVVTEAKAKDTTVVYTSASKSLPQTGVPAAALAGAGIATIAAGAGVTYLARRREA
ncbi:MAG: LPXTG cell wall anchor domain-containing protein [Nocardiaceae bacterium]|nr:LPXTG cell wall anchor domain-containing protein [Nocardiaceae bacterium]